MEIGGPSSRPEDGDPDPDLDDFMPEPEVGHEKDPGKGRFGTSSSTDDPMVVDKYNVAASDCDEDDEMRDVPELGINELEKMCKDAARAFFREHGLISHQINSYNDFVSRGLQELFDSFGVIEVTSGYDPSKKTQGEHWRHASVSFGEVRLERPTFWPQTGDVSEQALKLLPRHARMQNMTYSAQMKAKVTVEVYQNAKSDKTKSGTSAFVQKIIDHTITKEITIGRLPVMVKSRFCWLSHSEEQDCLFDYGGYFLIKGMEKTFIAQEQRCLTRIWLTDKPCWMACFISEIKRRRVYVKLVDAQKTEGSGTGKVISISFLYTTMPVWVMFFALGLSSDKEVFDVIDIGQSNSSLVNIIVATIKEADEYFQGFRQGDKACSIVDEKVNSSQYPPNQSFDECVTKYLFPSIIGKRQKALVLGYLVKCLLMGYSGKRKCDNKDDFRNKRLDLAGELLARELRAHILHAQKRMKKYMQKYLYGDTELEIERYFDASIITNGLNRAFSTGAWCHPYLRTERCSGIVATLRRTNPLQMMSDLRKTRQQVAYAGKAGDARYPNPSYWGKLCFLSTPDGENCGLVKNLAVMAIVTSKVRDRIISTSKGCDQVIGTSKGCDQVIGTSKVGDQIIDELVSCGMKKLEEVSFLPENSTGKITALNGFGVKVFLNGDWVGVCENPSTFVLEFKDRRRNKQINWQVEIKWDRQQEEVRIFSDAGRILRPLLVVESLKNVRKPKSGSYSFQSLVDSGIIEFIGVEEEEDCRAAWGLQHLFNKDEPQRNPKYTHCELDLSLLLGLSCSLIPFANHNMARRVLFQSEKHSQQAIGYSTTNPSIRTDTLVHQLFYPQRPLFKTFVADCLGLSEYPLGRKDDFARFEYFNGQNAIVAVNVHQGYNQEDSLVMNRASLERGMFRTEHLRSYKAEAENNDFTKRVKVKEKIDFGKVQSTRGRVDSLDDDGLPYVGASLQSGDIVIGKVSASGEDHSIKLKHTEKGMVHKVLLSANDEGKNFAVVTLRQVRSPCLGDKFSSMHGQKGVVGFLESQENFPFTHEGIVPDIVINPHAFPTRQTPGQLLEAAVGKGIACGGSVRYATPFSTPSFDAITDQLHMAGFSRWGAEAVLNGRTGERMQSLIFMGPNFYQRLVHMSEDKLKFRNTGPVHPLTRQPVADRKRFGGVKFGEMERDCLLAHGAAANLHERLFMLSDFSQMHICQTCERAANVIVRPIPGGKKIRGPYCAFCKSAENIVRVNVPYGAKLLYQELFSMGILLKFTTVNA